MPSLFGLTWSPAIATMRMLKTGVLKPQNLRPELLNGIEKDLLNDIKKRKKQGKPINYEVFAKQIFKDKNYVALYNELGIYHQIDTMIYKELGIANQINKMIKEAIK